MIEIPSHVVCVCLTKNRPEMLRRAVRCFESQTYKDKELLIYYSGHPRQGDFDPSVYRYVFRAHDMQGATIGELRNGANQKASRADIIAHWDDDDWSDPIRLAQQVNMLQLSAAHCIGYHDMPFWEVAKSEAWLYRAGKPNYALGTSLMYWRRVWEAKPFPDIHNGEDTEWQRNLNVVSTSAMAKERSTVSQEPYMIASIHGGNTNMAGYRINLTGKCEEFKRAPELDDVCRERMAL